MTQERKRDRDTQGSHERLAAVTGAAGFIGRSVVERLSAAGWRVRALVRRPSRELAEGGVELVQGSLEEEATLGRLVSGSDAVVHCAGAIRGGSGRGFLKVNRLGTRRLAAAVAADSNRPRVLFVSSLAAREPGISPYATSKRSAERELVQAGDRFDYVVVRPTAVYGPRDRATLPLFRQLARGRIVLPAPPENRFSLLYVEDLAEAVVHLLEAPRWGGEIAELTDGRVGGYTWKSLLEIASRHLGRPVRAVMPPRLLLWAAAAANEALSPLLGQVPFFTRGKLRELSHADWTGGDQPTPLLEGWRPRFVFERGLPATLAWYRQQGWL